MVSVKAAATGKVSCGPMVSGLGPLEHPVQRAHVKQSPLKATLEKSSLWVSLLCG